MPMAARLSNRQYPNADNSSIEKLKTIYFNSIEGAFPQVKQLHQNESNVINKKETNWKWLSGTRYRKPWETDKVNKVIQ